MGDVLYPLPHPPGAVALEADLNPSTVGSLGFSDASLQTGSCSPVQPPLPDLKAVFHSLSRHCLLVTQRLCIGIKLGALVPSDGVCVDVLNGCSVLLHVLVFRNRAILQLLRGTTRPGFVPEFSARSMDAYVKSVAASSFSCGFNVFTATFLRL